MSSFLNKYYSCCYYQPHVNQVFLASYFDLKHQFFYNHCFSKFTLSVKFSLLHLNISYNLHNIPEQTCILTGNIPVNIPAFLLLEVNNYFGNLYLHTTNNEVAMKSHKPNYQYFTDIGPALSQSKTRLYYRLELNVLGQTKRKKKSVCISFFFKRLFSL